MNLALLFPLGLLALAAWLVPLLVHLARRHHYAPLDFAALRWLRAKVRPRQRIRLDEWPLLLVRLLLLAALAVLLARPVLHGYPPDPRAVVAVAPGLDASALPAPLPNVDWRWLAPGFPPLDAPPPATAQPLASLLRELDQTLPAGTALSVYVPDPMEGLDGERPRLSRAVTWHAVPMAPAVAAPAPRAAPVLHVGGAADAGALRVLAALQRAWGGPALATGAPADEPPARGQVGVWAASTALPPAWQDWLTHGGTVLMLSPAPDARDAPVVLRDADHRPVLVEHAVGQGRQLRFTTALSPALPMAADATFPHALRALLQPTPPPQRAAAATQAPLRGATAPRAQPLDLAPWVLLLVVLLFALERWLATAPRRGAGA